MSRYSPAPLLSILPLFLQSKASFCSQSYEDSMQQQYSKTPCEGGWMGGSTPLMENFHFLDVSASQYPQNSQTNSQTNSTFESLKALYASVWSLLVLCWPLGIGIFNKKPSIDSLMP